MTREQEDVYKNGSRREVSDMLAGLRSKIVDQVSPLESVALKTRDGLTVFVVGVT